MGRGEKGCAVAAIAMAAEVSYTYARGRAAAIAGFDGTKGLTMDQARSVLSAMGISKPAYTQSGDWSSLPSRAIIGVNGPTGVNHAVVFVRDSSGNEYLYDSNHYMPMLRQHMNYKLRPGGTYVDLT